MASQKATEIIEAAESRRCCPARIKEQGLIFKRNAWEVFNKVTYKYDKTLDYESQKFKKKKR